MEKETKVEDEFLAGLDKEIGIDQPDDSLNDLFPQEEEVKEEGKEEKPIAFHKDPKVQRFIEKQVEKRLKDVRPTVQETFKEEVSQNEPKFISSMEKIIGNDTPEKIQALADLKEEWKNLGSRAKQEAMESFKEAQREEVEREAREVEEARDEIEEGLDDIESHYGIELNDRQKSAYKDFLLKIEPRGGYVEYPDFVETFEVFKNHIKANRPSNVQAKSLASKGMQQSSNTTQGSDSFVKTDGKQTLWQKFEKEKTKLIN